MSLMSPRECDQHCPDLAPDLRTGQAGGLSGPSNLSLAMLRQHRHMGASSRAAPYRPALGGGRIAAGGAAFLRPVHEVSSSGA